MRGQTDRHTRVGKYIGLTDPNKIEEVNKFFRYKLNEKKGVLTRHINRNGVRIWDMLWLCVCSSKKTEGQSVRNLKTI